MRYQGQTQTSVHNERVAGYAVWDFAYDVYGNIAEVLKPVNNEVKLRRCETHSVD